MISEKSVSIYFRRPDKPKTGIPNVDAGKTAGRREQTGNIPQSGTTLVMRRSQFDSGKRGVLNSLTTGKNRLTAGKRPATWRRSQAVKAPDFDSGIAGSIPAASANENN